MHRVLPDLSIRQLEYLVAVNESPNWASAAERVGVSPSALSQGLSELERRIGVPLFDRDGRRRVFRPAAGEVLAHARQVVALTADLASWADRSRTGASGQLRVGMIDAAAVGHYPGVIAGFRERHPTVEFRLQVAPSGLLLDELESGRLDLVLCVEPDAPRRGIRTKRIMGEELAIITRGESVPRDPSRWGPWVLFAEGSHTRSVIEHALVSLGAPLNVVTESNQPEVLRAMVALGEGWTVLPMVQAGEGLRVGRIIAERNLVLARRDGAAVDPVAEMFADAVLA
ncbi:MAG: LysR family transcriptional regulator [Acidimicrobiales bacterium]|nr:LysR family transcriptional regulator [Acidimicrobiales bacterium]